MTEDQFQKAEKIKYRKTLLERETAMILEFLTADFKTPEVVDALSETFTKLRQLKAKGIEQLDKEFEEL